MYDDKSYEITDILESQVTHVIAQNAQVQSYNSIRVLYVRISALIIKTLENLMDNAAAVAIVEVNMVS